MNYGGEVIRRSASHSCDQSCEKAEAVHASVAGVLRDHPFLGLANSAGTQGPPSARSVCREQYEDHPAALGEWLQRFAYESTRARI